MSLPRTGVMPPSGTRGTTTSTISPPTPTTGRVAAPDQVSPWRSLEWIIAPLRDFGLQHPDKGLMLAEWASATQGGDKAAWITEAARAAQAARVGAVHRRLLLLASRPELPELQLPDRLVALGDGGLRGDGGGSLLRRREGLPPAPLRPNTIFTGASTPPAPPPHAGSPRPTPLLSVGSTPSPWTGRARPICASRCAWPSTNAWVGANTSTTQPKSLTVNLTAGTSLQGGGLVHIRLRRLHGHVGPLGDPRRSGPRPSVCPPRRRGRRWRERLTITASASDDVGVGSVAFTVDGTVVGTDIDGAERLVIAVGHDHGARRHPRPGGDRDRHVGSDRNGRRPHRDGGQLRLRRSCSHRPSTPPAALLPRWVATTFTPTATGSHTFVLDWSGSANLRFDVRVAATNVVVKDQHIDHSPQVIRRST